MKSVFSVLDALERFRCHSIFLSTILLLFSILVGCSTNAHAAITSYPEEFSDFFSEVKQNGEIKIAGASDSVSVSGWISYERFRIVADDDSHTKLRHYLESHFIHADIIDQIINDGISGFTTDPGCQQSLTHCILPTIENQTRYVFDFDHSLVRIFIGPGGQSPPLFTDKDKVYESSVNNHYGLLNWSTFNLYSDLESNINLNIGNLTTIGLPFGYIEIDSQYTSNHDLLGLYSTKYEFDYEAVKFQLSYGSYNPTINSTDELNDGSYFRGFGVWLGSSRNLLRNQSTASAEQIFFHAPSNGRLQIYRDDRLVLSKNVEAGQQSIQYSELPKGIYDIHYKLLVGDEVVLEDRRKVINSDQFSLTSGEFDFVLGGGVLTDNTTITTSTTTALKNDYRDGYVRGGLSYRTSPQLSLHTGLISNGDTYYAQLGGLYLFNNITNLQLLGGYSTTRDWYSSVRFNLGALYSSYQQFSSKESEKSEFIRELYRSDGHHNLNIGASYTFGPAFTYINYNVYSSVDPLSDRDNANDYLTAGLTVPLFGGTLSINAGYNNFTSGSDGSWNIATSWSYNFFESNITNQISVDVNQDGFVRNSNYLRTNLSGTHNSIGNYNLGISAAGVVEPDQISSNLSANLNVTNDYGRFNGYSYVTNQKHSQNSLTLGWSGGQILDFNGVGITNSRSNAYLALNYKELETEENTDDHLHLKYYSSKGQKAYLKGDLLTGKTLLVPIANYQPIDTTIEGDGNSIVENGYMSIFTRPGSIYRITPDVIRIDSLIVVLDDIDGNPIKQIQCVGVGCVSVEPISSDGVFRINYKFGTTPEVVSLKGRCIFDKESSESSFYKGYCLSEDESSRLDPSKTDSEVQDQNFGNNVSDTRNLLFTETESFVSLRSRALDIDKLTNVHLSTGV